MERILLLIFLLSTVFSAEDPQTSCTSIYPGDSDYKPDKVPCSGGNCLNGGTCFKTSWSSRSDYCFCLPGTNGTCCAEVADCKKEDLCGGDKSASCIYDRIRMKGVCHCIQISKQFDYKKMMCRGTCEGKNCTNGGVCNRTGEFKFCECLPGTTGDFCDNVTSCEKDRKLCADNAEVKCVYDRVRMNATCQCQDAKKEFDFKTKTCKVPCQGENCENGGTCFGNEKFKFCECLPGTTGANCSNITDCNKKNFCGSDYRVSCIYDTNLLKAVCQCMDSNKEFHPIDKVCRECDCGSNGVCYFDKNGETKCVCSEGFREFNGRCEEDTLQAIFYTLLFILAVLSLGFLILFCLLWPKRKSVKNANVKLDSLLG